MFKVHVAAEHPRQRWEGLCVPRHLSDDPSESGGSGARLSVLLRRRRLLVASQGRPQGHVHGDPARLQKPGGRRELAPLHGSVPRAAERAAVGHVRHLGCTPRCPVMLRASCRRVRSAFSFRFPLPICFNRGVVWRCLRSMTSWRVASINRTTAMLRSHRDCFDLCFARVELMSRWTIQICDFY